MHAVFAKWALLEDGWMEDLCLRLDGGRIVAIEAANRGDVCDVVIPGVGNAHSHAFQRALAGHAERRASGDDSFWSWRSLMYSLAAKMTPDRLNAIARQLYASMLESGYAAVVEFHYLLGGTDQGARPRDFLDALLDAAEATGIRLVYVPALYERGDFDAAASHEQQPFTLLLDRYLEHCDEARERIGGRHGFGVGAHSLRGVSPPSLAAIDRYSADAGLPMHIHAAEQPREVEACTAALGAPPVQWLLDNVDLDSRWTVVHATHVDANELSGLVRSGATTALCPSTEANLGDGLFPLADYLAADGSIAIGSDSQVTVDPLQELRWLEYGQRLVSGRRNVSAIGTPHTGSGLYRRACAGGARSCGFDGWGLAVGAPADMIVCDGRHPVFAGHEGDSLLDALVFAAAKMPVKEVIVDARVCVSEGRHPGRADYAEGYRAAVSELFPREASQR